MHKRYLEKQVRLRSIAIVAALVLLNCTALFFFRWLFQVIVWSLYSACYVFSEIIAFLHSNLIALSHLSIRFHRHRPPLENFNPSVDVFVACCGEELGIIRNTVIGAKNIEYDNKKIYILDDAKSAAVQTLAGELGVRYVTRQDRSSFKAGNLNNGMKYSDGEFILVLDADQVPRPYMIRKLIGYFVRNEIAFVQSVQTHECPEHDPYNSEDLIFHRSAELSKDAENAVISCGSGVIYRRKAINDIGGFSTWNLVEDLHTSYKLQQKGWVGIFYNYALSRGIAPPHYAGVARQRHKWATDTMRIFFWDNPLWKKGLSFKQKINYLSLCILYIFTGICIPIFLALPIWALFTNNVIAPVAAADYLLHRLPYFALALLMNSLLFRNKRMEKAYQSWNFFFPIFFQGIVDALRNRTLKMDVVITSKEKVREDKLPWWATARVQLLILCGYFASLIYSVAVFWINKDSFFINVIWIIWGAYLLFPLTLYVFVEQHHASINPQRIFKITNKALPRMIALLLVVLMIYYVSPADISRPIFSKQERVANNLLKMAKNSAQTGDMKRAQENYQAYLAMYPIDISVRREYAALLLSMHQYAASALQYKFLIDNNEAEKEDFLQYARALSWQGDYEHSLKEYALLAEKYPYDSTIVNEYRATEDQRGLKGAAQQIGLAQEVISKETPKKAPEGVVAKSEPETSLTLAKKTEPLVPLESSSTAEKEEPVVPSEIPVATAEKTAPSSLATATSEKTLPVTPIAPVVTSEKTLPVTASVVTPAVKPNVNLETRSTVHRYSFAPMFSIYWQDTVYRRINEGFNFRIDQDKKIGPDFTYFFSHFFDNANGKLGRSSFKGGYGGDVSDRLYLYANVGVNSYTKSVGETFTGKTKAQYNHNRGNVAFEYSHYDIIDTIDLFTPKYYTLVTNVLAAQHKITTNDLKIEGYQQLSQKLAFYGNMVYGMYSDNNIKRTLYLSPIYYLNAQWSIKYGFAYIDINNPSPYYYQHADSKIHQLRVEFNKTLSEKLTFNTEEVLSYEIRKGIGASSSAGVKYKVKSNIDLDFSVTYSFARDNDVNGDLNAISFTAAVKFTF